MSSYSEESQDQWSVASPLEVHAFSTSSSSPPQQVPGTCPLTDLLRSVGIQGYEEMPFLKILEQPQNHYKFRYKSEMENSHGCLYGKSFEMDRTLAKTYPEVELCNFNGEARIRCQLVQVNKHDEHPHRLCVGENEDINVQVPVKNKYRIRFPGLCIIYTKREDVTQWLFKKEKPENMSVQNISDLEKLCKKLAGTINLNKVCLKFSAHHLDSDEEICDPVYSDPISNSKSPVTNILRICRMSHTCTRACGGDDVIMLVDKVDKKKIKIRFFEDSEDGSGAWSQDAMFSESDVHHQYAIVFRTPPYKEQSITKRVKVWVELVRTTDGRRSDPVEFYYTPGPVRHVTKKRKLTLQEDQRSISLDNYSSNDSYDTIATSSSGALSQWGAFPSGPAAPAGPSPLLASAGLVPAPPAAPAPAAPLPAVEDDCLAYVENVNLDEIFNMPELFPDIDLLMDEPQVSMHGWIVHQMEGGFATQPCGLTQGGIELQGPQIMDLLESDSGLSQDSKDKTVSKKTIQLQHTYGDQVTIKMMVSRLQYMVNQIKIMDVNKKNTLASTLENLFDVRLSNGDTFLYLILPSKQPLLDYVIDLVNECNMTHLLNTRNDCMQTILHLAVVNNLTELFEVLLSKGCDPMLEDIEGNNVIHYAVMHEACLEPLMSAIDKLNIPHDLDAYNNERQTALHLAVAQRSERAARLLGERRGGARGPVGGYGRPRDAHGRAALQLAARGDRPRLLAALLDTARPEEIDEVDGRGYTALQIICDREVQKESLEMIKLLLDKNADPLLKGEGHNRTAWALARDKPAIRDLMRKYLTEDPDSSENDESEDEFESADEGEIVDQDDVLDLTQPLNNLSITTVPEQLHA